MTLKLAGHKLTFTTSDLRADCECGMWSMVSTQSEPQVSVEAQRKYAKEKHAQHLASVLRRRLRRPS